MRVVLDSNVLIQVLSNAKPDINLIDPKTGLVVDRAEARADALVERIDRHGGQILIPTPVLSEYLFGVNPESIQSHLELIGGFACFEVVSFDEIAAVECARMITSQELKQLDPTSSKAKLRFDRQIISIAKANNADEIWTHDAPLMLKAESLNIKVKSLADIDAKPHQIEAEF